MSSLMLVLRQTLKRVVDGVRTAAASITRWVLVVPWRVVVRIWRSLMTRFRNKMH